MFNKDFDKLVDTVVKMHTNGRDDGFGIVTTHDDRISLIGIKKSLVEVGVDYYESKIVIHDFSRKEHICDIDNDTCDNVDKVRSILETSIEAYTKKLIKTGR
ncbi:MAG: hypothetical protein ACRCX2_20250 [Paraclostridium sp.]